MEVLLLTDGANLVKYLSEKLNINEDELIQHSIKILYRQIFNQEH